MPIGSKAKRSASANYVMPPAERHNDSISLSTPVGQPTPQLFISAAQMCEKQGDISQARNNYQQALSMWPGHVEVLRAAARMEDRLGDLAVAENLYQQAVTANPQHAGAHNDLGLCLARQGKLEASVQVIEQAIQLQPDKALYRNNAATVLVEMRQDQRALGHLAAVHGAADANYNFGQLLVQRNRAADATPYFQAAVEQNPQLEHAHVALAKLRGQQVQNNVTATYPATAAPQPAGQAVAPQAPTYAPQTGPQLSYPSTARSPDAGASSYSPPTNGAATDAFRAANDPRIGSMPRYLPPVSGQPGAMQR
jgi:tetratricopeptide (TPR) repeat protein